MGFGLSNVGWVEVEREPKDKKHVAQLVLGWGIRPNGQLNKKKLFLSFYLLIK